MNKAELDDILSLNHLSEDARRAFLAKTREEQLLAILGMEAYLRGEIASMKRRQIDFESDLREYRKKRENKEGIKGNDAVDTTQKIANAIRDALGQRFDWGVYFRDKILPPILVIIATGILYIVFGGGVP
jgi:hypothetical protein